MHDAFDGLKGTSAALLSLLDEPAGRNAIGTEAVVAQTSVAIAVGTIASIERGAI